MSLYTPVFPPFYEINSSQNSPLENNSVALHGKQQHYVKCLRDVHLFLSTQNDMLSPPSCPSPPLSDRRVKNVKDKIHDILKTADGETPGMWTRISQTLKLGCVRGRYWSVFQSDPHAPEQDTDWILPTEELEWIEWEKKREDGRRLRRLTNASQQIASTIVPDSQRPNHASSAEPSQPHNATRHRHLPDVSPGTLRAAMEKVRKWQASMTSDVWHGSVSGTSPALTRQVMAASEGKGDAARPQRSHTLDFAVVKPAAKSLIGKRRGKSSALHTPIRADSAPTLLRKPKSPKLPNTPKVTQATGPADADKSAPEDPAKSAPVNDVVPKIVDVPETPYFPPSFPAHLETSTPLDNAKIFNRAKPSPILPVQLSTPPPSTPANPPEDRQLVSAEAHVVGVTSSLPSQINTAQSRKRSRTSSPLGDSAPNGPPVTPPAKRPRTQTQKSPPPVPNLSNSLLPNEESDTATYARDEAQDPNPGAASSRYPMGILEKGLDVPLTPGKSDQLNAGTDAQNVDEKIPSPSKSVKSYFSAPDSDSVDSPVKSNLLLESPVSPMLSYAQNASIFLPQITSTQVRKGSPTPGQTSNGMFGMGYSSQFDVERHVDRVSELLEKDVDFDGWLRDARTVEMSQD